MNGFPFSSDAQWQQIAVLLGFPPEVCGQVYFDDLNFDGKAVADHTLPSLNLTWDDIRETISGHQCPLGLLDVGASMSSLVTEALLRDINAQATDVLFPWHPTKEDFLEFVPQNLRDYTKYLATKPRSSRTQDDRETLRLLAKGNLKSIRRATAKAAGAYLSVAAEDLCSSFGERSVALVLAGCSVPKHSGSVQMFKKQLSAMLAICAGELRLYPFEILPARGTPKPLYRDKAFLKWVKDTTGDEFSFELAVPGSTWDQQEPETETKLAIFRRVH